MWRFTIRFDTRMFRNSVMYTSITTMSSLRRSVTSFHSILHTPNYLSLNHLTVFDGYIVQFSGRFCRVSIEIRIDGSNYFFGATMFIGDRITFIRFKIQYELKIQTRDIGAYWFCKYKKLVRKRYELSNPVQFYLIREDIKRWNIFSNIFDTTFLGRCSFVCAPKN